MTAPIDLSLTRRSLLAGAAAAAASPFLHRLDAAAQSALELRVSHILNHMSLHDKIGQLFMVSVIGNGMSEWQEVHLKEIKPGGILFETPNIGPADTVRPFTDAIHGTNRALPPLIAIDQEGGPVTRLAGDPSPGAAVLGQDSDTIVRRLARERAHFLGGYGFDINFAPVADIAYNASSYMIGRSFGNDPRVVAEKVAAVVSGSRKGRMAGAAKHFPGHGRAVEDSHFTMPVIDISRKDWLKTDALPFKSAIKQKVEMVMLGHLLLPQWDDVPASLSKVAIDILRTDLGYNGVVITDDLGMGALATMDSFDILDKAVAAGVDVFLWENARVPHADLVKHLQHRVEKGKVSEKRINASVRRMLRLKVQHFSL
ncbi:MAG: glycoside hydrolase family 3 N-terminal domain-containing protein [Thermomicrobiales bacterium]